MISGVSCGGGGSGGEPDGGSAADAAIEPDAQVDAGEPGELPRAEPAACRFGVPPSLGLTEGADYACGDLVVAEDRDRPEERAIRLHYVQFQGADSGAATIYLDGGPGGNGSSILAYLGFVGEPFLDGLLASGDFLVIAQRGTSLSEPSLVCDRGLACADELSQIADLPSYNTAANADDVDALRRVLGYEELNLYGISYGSRLAFEVLRRHGDHVRAAVVDGNVPAQVVWPAATPASFYSALTALDASCAADPGCAEAYGDLEATFLAGLDALDAEPVVLSVQGTEVTIDGNLYGALLFQLLYARSTYPYLPLMVSDLAERRIDRVEAFLEDLFQGFGGESELSAGLYYSVICGELFNPPDEGAFDEANVDVPAPIRERFSYSWYGLLSGCSSWPTGAPRPALSEPVESSVPSFVGSGTMDPITPPSFGDIAAETLSERLVAVYENSGHGATLQTACGRSTFVAFLADPGGDPDVACAEEIGTEYVLPSAAAAGPEIAPEQLRFELEHAPLPPGVRRVLDDAMHRAP